jgi:hypothetical protein
MHKFKDALDREWTVTISVAEIETIQTETGIDFGRPGNFERLVGDTKTFAGVLWVLLADQAAAKQLDAKAVKQGLVGDAVERAIEAVAEELIDFFPSAQRVPLQALMSAISQRAGLIQQQAAAAVERATPLIAAGKLDSFLGLETGKLAAAIAAATAVASSDSATESPASPA